MAESVDTIDKGNECVTNTFREVFTWKKNHEELFLREVLLVEPYLYKPSSKERGNAWRTIVQNLMKIREPVFKVTQRSVREKFTKMMEAFRKREAEEATASGIEVEYDEIFQALTDIKQRMDEASLLRQNECEKEKKKVEEEKSQAEEVRKLATERLGETRKRNDGEGRTTPKKKREALDFLEESMKSRSQQARKELELKEEELHARTEDRRRQDESIQQQQQLFLTMQQQQQQFMQQMQQQQQQQQQHLQTLSFLGELVKTFKK